MRNIFSIIFLFLMTSAHAQVKWMSLEEALSAQKVAPRKIFIDFYAEWCGPCKLMDKTTYGHPLIAKYLNEEYYAVKFDAESREKVTYGGRTFGNPGFEPGKRRNSLHEFTRYMNVSAVPTIVFLDEHSMPITILQGAFTAQELEPYLPFMASDGYKKITTREQWENYQRKFKSSIVE